MFTGLATFLMLRRACQFFCRAQLCWSATSVWTTPSVSSSVCLSVCHKPVPCEDKCSLL